MDVSLQMAAATLAGLTSLFLSPQMDARAGCTSTIRPVSIPEFPLRMISEREGDTVVVSYALGVGRRAGVEGQIKTLAVWFQRKVLKITPPDGWVASVEADADSYRAVWTWETPRADAPAEVTGFQVVLDASGPTYWRYSVSFTDGSLILAGAELKGSCSP